MPSLQWDTAEAWDRLRQHVAKDSNLVSVLSAMEASGWANVMWLATLHEAEQDDFDEHLKTWQLEVNAENRRCLKELAGLGKLLADRIWAKEGANPRMVLLSGEHKLSQSLAAEQASQTLRSNNEGAGQRQGP